MLNSDKNESKLYSEDEIKAIIKEVDLAKSKDQFEKWQKNDGKLIINDFLPNEKSLSNNQKINLYNYM